MVVAQRCSQLGNRRKKKPSMLTERVRQLEERTRVCTRAEWESSTTVTDKSHTCSICLSGMAPEAKVRGLACGHVFHLECVAKWFLTDATYDLTCPLCRNPLA